jgi:valyl-tRNA synthetase
MGTEASCAERPASGAAKHVLKLLHCVVAPLHELCLSCYPKAVSTELSKTYDPAAVEAETTRIWLEEKCFAADPAGPGKAYTIVIPPPNVTGALHLGHAINNTLQDILTRVHRMRGFNTLWVPGIDHAGIATQAVVEKQLKEKENKTRHDIGREELVRRIWEWKEQYGNRILEQLKRLGCSCDWDRTRFTLDDMCARAVRETFFKLFKDGLIYRGKRLVNWDTHLQTSISDDEIYHETVKTSLWHIKYPIVDENNLTAENAEDAESKNKNEFSALSASSAVKSSPAHPKFVTVATTRPETMLGDTAVAVHSEDVRWNWAIGKQVRLPLTDRLIPIIADDILVDPKFGSGVVKVTPAHDPNDYAVWQRHQGKPDEIGLINILNSDGTINENGGKYAGMKREAARKKVVEDLTALGLLVKEEPYETQVGHSDRSKTPIEPYLSDQWFVKMAPLAEPALEVVRNGTIKFFPERHAQQYLAWLGEKRDWPISRQLWWGHRIPVWTFELHSDHRKKIGTFSSVEAAKNRASVLHMIDEYLTIWGTPKEVCIQEGTESKIHLCASSVGAREALEALEEVCDRRVYDTKRKPDGNYPRATPLKKICAFPAASVVASRLNDEFVSFIQDDDVLDTWFSSALWPHSTLGWPEQTPELKKYYPTSVLLTGRDIITLWVARMVMTGMYNMGQHPSPSPGTPAFGSEAQARRGEGRGEGSSSQSSVLSPQSFPAHPNPPPEYRERGKELGIPFFHVAINPTILDGNGERMSKSKGNGVDPVDIIDTHGADALRFTMTLMATETQDARLPVKKDAQGRNTSEKFDIGRTFAIKLWNAARLTLPSLESAPQSPALSPQSLIERWIISSFNRAVDEANTALANYRFDQYAKVCYDFFWRDFCDWYLEAIKPILKDPAKAGAAANVLAAVFDGALRLMHPMIPFITEKIWWQLNEVRPERGLAGYIECSKSQRLIKAAWPHTGATDRALENFFARIHEVVVAIRNVRSEYSKANPSMATKKLDVTMISGEDAVSRIDEIRQTIEPLANCHLKDLLDIEKTPENMHSGVRVKTEAGEIIVEVLEDPVAKEQLRANQMKDLIRQIQTLKGRLENPGYLSKAPPRLVEQTKAQLAEAEAELAKLA